jgi:integrase
VRRASALAVDLGGRPRPTHLSVGDLVEDHLDLLAERASATYLDDVRGIAGRLPASLLDIPVADVEPADVEAAWRALHRAGWSAWRIERAHEVLAGAYSRAIRLRIVDASPLRGVWRPPRPETDITVPTTEQVRAIASAARNDVEDVFLRLAPTTGARAGELVALRWDAVDLDAATLAIVRSLAYTPRAGVHERPTKTGRKGQRVISLDADTVTRLRSWRKAQAERAIAAGQPSPRWVLSYDAGETPWRPDCVTRVFGRARRTARIEGVRLHDLRHYMATQMLVAGVALAIVSQRLGHASVATTARIYAHWITGADREAAEALGLLVSG